MKKFWALKLPWKQTTTPKQRHKFYGVTAGATVILLVGAAGAYEVAHPAYRRWKGERAVKQARAALQNHDEGQARIALRVAVSAGLSQDGFSALAEYYERVGSPLAIEARQSVFKQSPHDLNARLALIAAALRFHDTRTASEAIAGSSPAEKKDLRLQSSAAILALQTNQLPLANFLLDRMHAAAPHDDSIRFARADVMIHHPKPATAEAARKDLAELAGSGGPQRLPALRALLRDAIRRKDDPASARWAQQLAAISAATLGDLLNAADGIHPPGNAESKTMAPDLQSRVENLARKDARPAEQYASWLIARGHGVQAERWLDSLDPAFARQPRFAAVRADAAETSAEWGDLEARIRSGAWGSIAPASVELSFAARSLEAQGDHALALRAFQASLDQSRASDASLNLLSHLAQAWRWPAAEDLASGAAVLAFPQDPRPYPRWTAHLRTEAKTAALRDALDGWRTADPANLEARYNWALTSLLIDTSHPSPAAVEVMEKFYESDRANPLYITGAAFARFRLGRTKEAAALLAQLKPVALRRPQRAPYAAAILAASGQVAAAKTVAGIAPAPEALLPEERELLRQAAAQWGG